MDPTREELEAMLADYVDGNLTGDELARAESFLEANPGVREVMGRLMVDSEAIRTLPRVAPPVPDLTEDLRGSLERDMLLGDGGLPVTRPRRLSTPALAIAAMLMVGLGAGVVAYEILGNRPESPFVAVKDDAPDPSTTKPTSLRESRNGLSRTTTSANRSEARRETPAPTTAAAPFDLAFGHGGGGAAGVATPAAVPDAVSLAPNVSNVQLAAGTLPSDVAGWVEQQSVLASEKLRASAVQPAGLAASFAETKRRIVFVIDADADAAAAADELAESAATYFETAEPADANVPTMIGGDRRASNVTRVPLANARDGMALADRTAADRDFAARADIAATRGGTGVVSNVAAPTAMDDALRDGSRSRFGELAATRPATTAVAKVPGATQPAVYAGLTPSAATDDTHGASSLAAAVIARDVPEAVAARWQVQTDATLGGGRVTAYDLSDVASSGVGFGAIPTTLPTPAITSATTVPSLASDLGPAEKGQTQQTQVSGVFVEQQAAQMPQVGPMRQQQMGQTRGGGENVDVYVVVRSNARSAPATAPATMPATTRP